MDTNNDNPRSKLNSNDSTFSDEILKLAQTLMPEPPTTKVKRMVAEIADKGIDRQLHELGWKAYDTVVGAANNATNRVFTSPTVGNVLGGAIDIMLRYQRFNAAVAGAFFSALWPAVGLPSATELEAVRGEVRAMREELRDAVADRESKDDFASELHIAVRESIVNQQADEKSATPETNGHTPAAAPAKKSSVYQFSVWSGWPGADPMELGEDVGN
ncbi:hypothetical protein [Candidatus Binatus sp.]|uniref:hypothetical protein n=1 Tax=Candidatus Binatus sp. TaxID=2811406 RepID=UPI003C75DEF8